MGVSLSFRGSQPSLDLREEAFAFARQFAADMEWTFRPVDLSRRRARLGHLVLEMPRIEGLALSPHFACEPIPLVFLHDRGLLVDSYVQDEGEGEIALASEVLIKTQFAGATVHEEVCDFLAELKRRFVPDLEVDDETGFCGSRDRDLLLAAFRQSWEALGTTVQEWREEGRDSFEVGGFPFEAPGRAAGGEFSLISEEHQILLKQAEAWVQARYGGFGYTLDRSRESIADLDLLMSDADENDWAEHLEDPDVESFIHGVGAYFGRTLAQVLGAAWAFDEEDGLQLVDVARLGLRINPFQIAAERLVTGPSHAFGHHLGVYETFVEYLR